MPATPSSATTPFLVESWYNDTSSKLAFDGGTLVSPTTGTPGTEALDGVTLFNYLARNRGIQGSMGLALVYDGTPTSDRATIHGIAAAIFGTA